MSSLPEACYFNTLDARETWAQAHAESWARQTLFDLETFREWLERCRALAKRQGPAFRAAHDLDSANSQASRRRDELLGLALATQTIKTLLEAPLCVEVQQPLKLLTTTYADGRRYEGPDDKALPTPPVDKRDPVGDEATRSTRATRRADRKKTGGADPRPSTKAGPPRRR
jgi:hypothetical protein